MDCVRLSYGAYEPLVHENKVDERNESQNQLKRKDCGVSLDCRKVSVLKDVCEDEDLEEYGAS